MHTVLDSSVHVLCLKTPHLDRKNKHRHACDRRNGCGVRIFISGCDIPINATPTFMTQHSTIRMIINRLFRMGTASSFNEGPKKLPWITSTEHLFPHRELSIFSPTHSITQSSSERSCTYSLCWARQNARWENRCLRLWSYGWQVGRSLPVCASDAVWA